MQKQVFRFEVEGAAPIEMSFGHIARQAHGAVWVRQGGHYCHLYGHL
jgi:polyribonucleotide nucleotidyltransferase